MSNTRRLAFLLTHHAERVLHKSDWSAAMARETEHIPDDRRALAWAAGCVAAAYRTRARKDLYFLPAVIRILLAYICLHHAYWQFQGPWAAAQCHVGVAQGQLNHWQCARWLYAVPLAQHLLWLAGGCLSSATAFQLLRNRDAFRFAGLTLLGTLASFFHMQTLPVYAFSWQHVSPEGYARLLANVALLPLLFAGAIWFIDRYRMLRSRAERLA
jgi:hypothetical protein